MAKTPKTPLKPETRRLVNAAGVIKRQPSIDMPVAEFERICRVNLTGSFIVAQQAGRIMKSQTADEQGQRGNIIFIASLNSYISLTEVLAYASSKSGVLGLIRGLANEWAQYGIRVNGIAPGVFPTDLNRKLIEGTPRGEFLKAHTPLGRFGKTEDLRTAAAARSSLVRAVQTAMRGGLAWLDRECVSRFRIGVSPPRVPRDRRRILGRAWPDETRVPRPDRGPAWAEVCLSRP